MKINSNHSEYYTHEKHINEQNALQTATNNNPTDTQASRVRANHVQSLKQKKMIKESGKGKDSKTNDNDAIFKRHSEHAIITRSTSQTHTVAQPRAHQLYPPARLFRARTHTPLGRVAGSLTRYYVCASRACLPVLRRATRFGLFNPLNRAGKRRNGTRARAHCVPQRNQLPAAPLLFFLYYAFPARWAGNDEIRRGRKGERCEQREVQSSPYPGNIMGA